MTKPVPTTPDLRIAQFLRLLTAGYSQRAAARLVGASRETVFRWRRTKPEFAAALHEAEQISADVRRAEREDDVREQYFAHALDQADRHEREGRPAKKDEHGTRRQRRLLAKLHGVNTSLFPGASPSGRAPSSDPAVTAAMADAFAERRREKRGEPPASPKHSEPRMSPPQQAQFLLLVTCGYSVASAARKVGLHKDDIVERKTADPEFARRLVEAMEAGAGAFRKGDEENTDPPKKTGRAGVLW